MCKDSHLLQAENTKSSDEDLWSNEKWKTKTTNQHKKLHSFWSLRIFGLRLWNRIVWMQSSTISYRNHRLNQVIPNNLLIQPDPKKQKWKIDSFQQKHFICFGYFMNKSTKDRSNKFDVMASRIIKFYAQQMIHSLSLIRSPIFVVIFGVGFFSFPCAPSIKKSTNNDSFENKILLSLAISLSRFQNPLETRKRNLRAIEYQLSYFVNRKTPKLSHFSAWLVTYILVLNILKCSAFFRLFLVMRRNVA